MPTFWRGKKCSHIVKGSCPWTFCAVICGQIWVTLHFVSYLVEKYCISVAIEKGQQWGNIQGLIFFNAFIEFQEEKITPLGSPRILDRVLLIEGNRLLETAEWPAIFTLQYVSSLHTVLFNRTQLYFLCLSNSILSALG